MLVFCLALCSDAQEEEIDLSQLSRSKLKKLARQAERSGDLKTAVLYEQAYLDKKANKHQMQYRLANHYRRLGAFEEALLNYRQLAESERADKFPLLSFYLAEMLVAHDSCKKAIPIYEAFRKDYRGEKEDRKYRRLAKFAIRGCELKSNAGEATSTKMTIRRIAEPINGDHLEGAPIHLTEEKWIYNSLKSDQTTFQAEDSIPKRAFYQMEKSENQFKDQGLWEVLKNFKAGEIANGAFNKDQSRFYFAACSENLFKKISCDLYKIEKNEEQWSAAERLPETINTKRYTETQVAVGIDEKGRETLYFVSDRKAGKGELDIWYSTFYKGSYRKARNCGSKVNSVGNEMTPFIHPLTNKLYFSSDGHPGYGLLDIFSTAGQRSRWKEPENIGSAINSPADELYYAAHPKGDEGIFASNRQKKKGASFCCDDLYYFVETDQIKVTASGRVQSDDGDALRDVEIKVYQLSEDGETVFIQSNKTKANGSYDLVLEPNQKYLIRTYKSGFLAEEKNLQTANSPEDQNYQLDFKLKPKLNQVFIIENIYYDFDRAGLREESKITIDTTIYKILSLNPEIIVEIGSHTDSKGTNAYNIHLSQQRAESVVNYLRKKGIDQTRIKAKGYGEEVPIAPNVHPDGSDNPEGRQKNRRTEFKVIGEIELNEVEED